MITLALIVLAVLGSLMAADWYVWDPRLRDFRSAQPQDGSGKQQILRTAA